MRPFIWCKTRGVNQGAPEDVAYNLYENGQQKRSFFRDLLRRFKNRNTCHVLHWICITGKNFIKLLAL